MFLFSNFFVRQAQLATLAKLGPLSAFLDIHLQSILFLKGNGQSLAKNPFSRPPGEPCHSAGESGSSAAAALVKYVPKPSTYVQRVSSCIFSGFMQLIKVSYLERKGEKMVKKVSSYLEHYTSL